MIKRQHGQASATHLTAMIKNPIPLAILMALPVSLQSCAPKAQPNAYGENVSYYFNSSAACPAHVPKWQALDESLLDSPRGARSQGDASDAFTEALVNLGRRASAAVDSR